MSASRAAGRVIRRAVAIACFWVPAACFSNTINEPTELAISLTASPTSAAVGQTIVFRFSASGPVLTTITVDFGDETSDVTDAAGAQTAAGNIPHEYTAPGTFEVTATAVGAEGESASARLSIQIRAAAPVADRQRMR